MEGEVVDARQVAWEPRQHEEGWNEQKVRYATQQAKNSAEREVVKETVLDEPFTLV